MRERTFKIFLLVIASSFFGCAHEWQNPNTSLPAKEVKIKSILINPIAYDSAGVIVEGKVWDLRLDTVSEKDVQIPYTGFKLADEDGNFVNVFALGDIPVVEGDLVKVVGVYRREYNTEGYKFINEIEAKRVENKGP
jgi:hypothetical protein